MKGHHLRQLAALSRGCPGSWCSALVACLALAVAPSAQAEEFQVFCTNNADGTVSCSGWPGGELLTCVVSSGGTSSCTTPSGRGFVCVRQLSGVSSCRPNGQNALDRPAGGGTQCTFTGDGNFVCQPPARRGPELLPRPGLSGGEPINQEPGLNQGVDLDLIQPLAP